MLACTKFGMSKYNNGVVISLKLIYSGKTILCMNLEEWKVSEEVEIRGIWDYYKGIKAEKKIDVEHSFIFIEV